MDVASAFDGGSEALARGRAWEFFCNWRFPGFWCEWFTRLWCMWRWVRLMWVGNSERLRGNAPAICCVLLRLNG